MSKRVAKGLRVILLVAMLVFGGVFGGGLLGKQAYAASAQPKQTVLCEQIYTQYLVALGDANYYAELYQSTRITAYLTDAAIDYADAQNILNEYYAAGC